MVEAIFDIPVKAAEQISKESNEGRGEVREGVNRVAREHRINKEKDDKLALILDQLEAVRKLGKDALTDESGVLKEKLTQEDLVKIALAGIAVATEKYLEVVVPTISRIDNLEYRDKANAKLAYKDEIARYLNIIPEWNDQVLAELDSFKVVLSGSRDSDGNMIGGIFGESGVFGKLFEDTNGRNNWENNWLGIVGESAAERLHMRACETRYLKADSEYGYTTSPDMDKKGLDAMSEVIVPIGGGKAIRFVVGSQVKVLSSLRRPLTGKKHDGEGNAQPVSLNEEGFLISNVWDTQSEKPGIDAQLVSEVFGDKTKDCVIDMALCLREKSREVNAARRHVAVLVVIDSAQGGWKGIMKIAENKTSQELYAMRLSDVLLKTIEDKNLVPDKQTIYATKG